ncbi:MAG: hypothetical protein FIA99_10050 [Ruminiclostridium sp.]|nr:hypothetical protein [Ruminiclostridium sp.]
MKAGVVSVDITPAVGVVLGGNGRKDNKSRGVHDPLFANIIALNENNNTVVFIGLDVLGILKEDVDEIKKGITAKHTLEGKDIVITATHTHSGPNIIRIFASTYSARELDEIDVYRKELINKVINAADEALNGMFPCKFGYGKGIAEEFSFNRRIFLKDGSFIMGFEEHGLNDVDRFAGPSGYPVMSVYKITDFSGKVRAVHVNYASHPALACGEGLLFSRDYVHGLTEALKERYGKDIVVLYTNGSQGNLIPFNPFKQPFVTGFEESDRVGRGLADAAVKIIESIVMKDCLRMKTALREIELPIRKIPGDMVAIAEELLKNHAGKDIVAHGLDPSVEADGVVKLYRCGKKTEKIVIQAVNINETLIVTLPGEVFIEFGLQIIEDSPFDNTMIFGLANGYSGYIPTSEAFSQGGYEIKPSYSSSKFVPEAGDILVGNVKNLIMEDIFAGGNHNGKTAT